jgi:hypothetical protein
MNNTVRHPEFDWVVEYWMQGEDLKMSLKIGSINAEENVRLQNWLHKVYQFISNDTWMDMECCLLYSKSYREFWKYTPNKEPEFIKEERFNIIP